MTKPFTQAQSKDIAEKTAIIANQAFVLGRQSEADRIKGYIKEQQCELTVDTGICEHDNCYLLGDIIAYINQHGKHEKNEIKL
jgi:hypothetical protein